MATAAVVACRGHTLARPGSGSQARLKGPRALCSPLPAARPLLRGLQRGQHRRGRAPAPRVTAALLPVVVPALSAVSKALMLGVTAAWVSCWSGWVLGLLQGALLGFRACLPQGAVGAPPRVRASRPAVPAKHALRSAP